MNANDWITLVSACVAAFAFIVSGRALQLQRAGARGSTQQQFDDVVHQLGIALGKIGGTPASPVPGSVGFPPSGPTALGEIQTLALRAHDLLHPPSDGAPKPRWYRRLLHLWSPSSPLPEHNWFDAVTMALSFAQVWDTVRARIYWDSAAQLAMSDTQIGPSAEIYTQRFLGAFYYSVNTDADLERARAAYDRAANILQPEVNGADITFDMNYETRMLQAQQEDQLGNTAKASQYIGQAWQLSTQVRALWRRQRARYQLVSLVAFGGDPGRFDAYGVLPLEIRYEAASMRAYAQQQGPSAQQQALGDALPKGYAAAQELFGAAHPTGPRAAGDATPTTVPFFSEGPVVPSAPPAAPGPPVGR